MEQKKMQDTDSYAFGICYMVKTVKWWKVDSSKNSSGLFSSMYMNYAIYIPTSSCTQKQASNRLNI